MQEIKSEITNKNDGNTSTALDRPWKGCNAQPLEKIMESATSVNAIQGEYAKCSPSHYVDVSMSEEENAPKPELTESNCNAASQFTELKFADACDPLESELYEKHHITREFLLVTQGPMQIPSMTERTIQVRLPKTLINHDGPLLIQPLPIRKGLRRPPIVVAPSISHANGSFICVRILNVQRHVAHLAELTALATIESDVEMPTNEPPKDMQHTWATLTQAQRDTLEKCDIDPDKQLSPEQLVRTKDLLAKHVRRVPSVGGLRLIDFTVRRILRNLRSSQPDSHTI